MACLTSNAGRKERRRMACEVWCLYHHSSCQHRWHAIVRLACTISHDASRPDLATRDLASMPRDEMKSTAAYVRTGSTLIKGLEGRPLIIGNDMVIGAGSCVSRDVVPGTTVVDVSAPSR